MKSRHAYPQAAKDAIYKAIAERRDMRHFCEGEVEREVLQRILAAAHQAPSVGLMQPWRFMRITQSQLRDDIHALVQEEVALTAEALGESKADFLRLKVEGIKQCAELVVAALPDKREAHIFGRRTLPEMDLASLSCAIQNMWLAARAEGIGMGWVSLFDPAAIKTLLNMPEASHPIAILCIGHVEAFYDEPMLIAEGWAEAVPLEELISENTWPESPL